MFGCNSGFCVVARKAISFSRFGQPVQPDLDSLPVPERSVLLFQEKQATGSVLASGHPRHVEMHQSQEGERFWNLAYRVLRQLSTQSNRFLTELSADRHFRVR